MIAASVSAAARSISNKLDKTNQPNFALLTLSVLKTFEVTCFWHYIKPSAQREHTIMYLFFTLAIKAGNVERKSTQPIFLKRSALCLASAVISPTRTAEKPSLHNVKRLSKKTLLAVGIEPGYLALRSRRFSYFAIPTRSKKIEFCTLTRVSCEKASRINHLPRKQVALLFSSIRGPEDELYSFKNTTRNEIQDQGNVRSWFRTELNRPTSTPAQMTKPPTDTPPPHFSNSAPAF